MTSTFLVWVVAQALGTYGEFFSQKSLLPVSEILFVFSSAPLGMVLFLDPDNEPNRFDRLHILDFVQALLFWSSAYLYFQGIESGAVASSAIWKRDIFYNSVIAGAFFLRITLTGSPVVRALFGRMLLFLLLSGVADAYANFPGRSLWAGGWFDIVWTMLIAMPLLIAAGWRKVESSPVAERPARARSIVVQQLFPLLYPSLVLLLSLGVARSHPAVGAMIVLTSFACFSGRLLVTQHRLQLSETHLHEANAQLALLSSLDGLTGVANRRVFDVRLDEEWRRAWRDGDPLAVIMIDIDHFKALNDSLGHQQGDNCLIRIATELHSRVKRAADLVARFGGEEFVLLLPGMSALQAEAFAEELRRGIEDMRLAHPGSDAGFVTASIGVAGVDRGQFTDSQAFLRAADQALYAAKRAGRNTVVCTTECAVA